MENDNFFKLPDNVKHLQILSDYLAKKVSLADLSTYVDDRLFELRQSPNETSEQSFLSDIELMICELRDGFRSNEEFDNFILLLVTSESLAVDFVDDKPQTLKHTIACASNIDIRISKIISPYPVVEDYHLVVEVS